LFRALRRAKWNLHLMDGERRIAIVAIPGVVGFEAREQIGDGSGRRARLMVTDTMDSDYGDTV